MYMTDQMSKDRRLSNASFINLHKFNTIVLFVDFKSSQSL